MTIQAIADQAGVSVATVSRAFNTPDKVAPDTLARIERIAQELSYRLNTVARSLRTQRSRVLGVVLPTLLNPVFAECLQGIAEAAAAHGYAILPTTTAYETAQELVAANLMLSGRVDGVILVVSNPAASPALAQLRAAGLPYVLAHNAHPAQPCVSVDNEAAAAGVVAHLAALGHRRIGMVSGTLAASDRAQQRLRGYRRGMAEAGLAALSVLEVPFIQSAMDNVSGFLRDASRPTALFCSNDLVAIRCIRAAQKSGLRVPQDLAVAGFDGIALGEDMTPALSTVLQPNHDIGRRGVELLVDALAHGTVPGATDSVLLPHAFRAGESCGPPAAP